MCKVFGYLSWFVVNFLILISSVAGKLAMPVLNTCSECAAYQHGNQPIVDFSFLCHSNIRLFSRRKKLVHFRQNKFKL